MRIHHTTWPLLLLMACHADAEPNPCAEDPGTYIDVDTALHRLNLCAAGSSERGYPVRLGKHGVGKRVQGDGKTPLGRYPLGKPRPSSTYGTFILIGYPTARQLAEGYTGSAVGIHGPDRKITWLGKLANTFDTTDGCVGLATDAEMASISAWIKRTKPTSVILH